jgi:Family of unknown function (DUF6662)
MLSAMMQKKISSIVKKTAATSICTLGCALVVNTAQADEQLFGFVRSAETLPHGHFEVYQFLTLREGKNTGSYYGTDFDTEVEYGFTDKFQGSVSLVNHYFNYHGVDELEDKNQYRFGGVEVAGKYRILSPFKDAIGLALRTEGGFLINDEVGGLPQHELFFAPELILHKNFMDDTLIFNLNGGVELAWGKRPAEQYDHELSLQGALGAAYRFAPKWFVGLEGRVRSEYPMFHIYEHTVVYAGPSLHYSAKRWWATLTYQYQVWGNEVDPVVSNKAFAEETRNVVRVKVGFNF